MTTPNGGRIGPRQRVTMVIGLAAMIVPDAAFAGSSPPSLDCGLGIDGARAAATSLPGAAAAADGAFDIVTAKEPDAWIVEYAFTSPGHPAHPAMTLRTQIKQVTGVWTSQSKGCGFGDQSQFLALMAHMKTRDSELTNASRAQVEHNK